MANSHQKDPAAIATTPEAEEDPSYMGQPSIQPEALDLGFGHDSPRVDEVGQSLYIFNRN